MRGAAEERSQVLDRVFEIALNEVGAGRAGSQIA